METYSKLMRLTRLGDSLVDRDFLDGLRSDPITDSDAVEDISATYSLAAFDAAVTSCITKHTTKPEAGDAELAEAVHRALGIPRRIAMDMGVWRFLTCTARPDYVRYRWGVPVKVTQERFLGGIKRNAFARLWWCAEIMRLGDDYSRVAACFESQDLYEAVFGRVFSKFPPAAIAFVGAVKGQHREKVIRPVAKDLSLMLSTFVLEDLSEKQIYTLVTERVNLRRTDC